MTGFRSEGNAMGNAKFPDLNLTRYPAKIDSKTVGDAGYNINMKGFWNSGDPNIPNGQAPDYNMAEHVNALADAVMAMQRILGVNPHVDNLGQNTTGTVSTRIAAAENKDLYYDARYGGQGWNTSLGQTILTHTHGGGTNEAPKINLVDEVSGKLEKNFINLAAATGITGMDIFISSGSAVKLSDAVNDKLSVSQGGTISGALTLSNTFNSRMNREYTHVNFSGSQVADYTSASGIVRKLSGKTSGSFLQAELTNLLCGKYVVGVRLKTDSIPNEDIIELSLKNDSSGLGNSTFTTRIKGTDFTSINKWQMFYLIGDVERWSAVTLNHVNILKLSTTVDVAVSIDNAYIMPVHPAVFDR